MKQCNFYFLITCFFTLFATAQEYSQVDATIQLYPKTVNNPEELSYFISRDFATDDEKVRAIYSWLITNVAYDPAMYKAYNYSFATYSEGNKKEAKTRARIIKQTLQTGKAVCEGYAMTFEILCQLQGINSYLIRGDTKTHFKDIGRPFANNHIWNAVRLNTSYYLFDATWGAGTYTDKFVKAPTFQYYKIDPAVLINTHYPEQFEDAFIKENISKINFSERPLLVNGVIKYEDIKKQKKGILEHQNFNGTIDFEFNAKVKEISYSYGEEPINLYVSKAQDSLIKFSIPLELGADQLLIYFDGKPTIGYLIK